MMMKESKKNEQGDQEKDKGKQKLDKIERENKLKFEMKILKQMQ